jgi:hypothetical protein
LTADFNVQPDGIGGTLVSDRRSIEPLRRAFGVNQTLSSKTARAQQKAIVAAEIRITFCIVRLILEGGLIL